MTYSVLSFGDVNGHLGRHNSGFDCLPGEYGVSQRNFELTILVEFCVESELFVSNT